MSKPLSRQQLDQGRCHNENCPCSQTHGPLYLHGKCHPGAGNEVRYENGVLHLRCNECKAVIVDVLVAHRHAPPPPPRRARR